MLGRKFKGKDMKTILGGVVCDLVMMSTSRSDALVFGRNVMLIRDVEVLEHLRVFKDIQE